MDKPPSSADLDDFDRTIVAAPVEDGRMTVTDPAQRIGLSRAPCQIRLRRLIESGVIHGFRAIVDPAKPGMDHVAFAEVKLSDVRKSAFNEFNAAVCRISEVEECRAMETALDASGGR